MEIYEAITIKLVDEMDKVAQGKYKIAQGEYKITQRKWNKLLFFIDGAGLCLNGKLFTDFRYIKLPLGPVPEDYAHHLKHMHGKEMIERIKEVEVSISKTLIGENNKELLNEANEEIQKHNKLEEIMKKIINIFMDWDDEKISDFSHEFDAWRKPSMYGTINMKKLKNDTFLKEEYGEGDFGKLIMNP